MRRLTAGVALAGASLLALAAGAAAGEFTPMDREGELSQAAADLAKGQVFLTQGLVCDKPAEIDAVLTLSNGGETLMGAVKQINAGASVPRCVVGKALFARYEAKSRTFKAGSRIYHIHQVAILAVGTLTPRGVLPMRLEKPMRQYVVSADRAQNA